jgi:hypothetical protein
VAVARISFAHALRALSTMELTAGKETVVSHEPSPVSASVFSAMTAEDVIQYKRAMIEKYEAQQRESEFMKRMSAEQKEALQVPCMRAFLPCVDKSAQDVLDIPASDLRRQLSRATSIRGTLIMPTKSKPSQLTSVTSMPLSMGNAGHTETCDSCQKEFAPRLLTTMPSVPSPVRYCKSCFAEHDHRASVVLASVLTPVGLPVHARV